ncbi:unnamed protein product [Linum tenue]|uniref:BRCT domain-containing protein n=1 Tax=Linum tenue TaxID=586396 RepID=A0AAV0KNS1_9ROSI|nr:unnamed protein product [Linum tenue]
MNSSKDSGGGNKRSLPSWMNSDDNNVAACRNARKNPKTGGRNQEETRDKEDVGSPSNRDLPTKGSAGPSSSTPAFSKLLEGVVFVLSGFVNPERATLRSNALDMGAEYRPDWGSDCTLLVCAYSNTPKFRQVEADCGTIVRKEWILECYSQKRLVEIDSYLMHPGKPWRKGRDSDERINNGKESPSRKRAKESETLSHSGPIASGKSNTKAPKTTKKQFSGPEVKNWAIDDLNKTISWLETQDEKPEPSEIRQIAAEGVIICLQDAIDSLKEDQDVRKIANQWNVVPRALEELLKLLGNTNGSAAYPKEDICRQAKEFKEAYEAAFSSLDDDSKTNNKGVKNSTGHHNHNERSSPGYDSDDTIEMTEEEVDLAYSSVASQLS